MKFSKRLQMLGFSTYDDYLASSLWTNFRRSYKAAGCRMTCLVCGTTPVQLHHQTYVRLGRERHTDVIPVCRAHHVAIHDWLKINRRNCVEYTSEAVVAMGGTCYTPPKQRMLAVEGKALGLRKRDERVAGKWKKKKKKNKRSTKLQKQRAKQLEILSRLPTEDPDVTLLLLEFKDFKLKLRQRVTVARLAAKGDTKQLRGFLKSLRNVLVPKNEGGV